MDFYLLVNELALMEIFQKNINDSSEIIGTENVEVTLFVNNVFKLSFMVKLVKELPIFYNFGLVSSCQ